jgi:hypothetical protein
MPPNEHAEIQRQQPREEPPLPHDINYPLGQQPPGIVMPQAVEKAAVREPIFSLRAQDELASEVVRFWCEKAMERGVAPAKVKQALDIADAMDDWPTKKLPD